MSSPDPTPVFSRAIESASWRVLYKAMNAAREQIKMALTLNGFYQNELAAIIAWDGSPTLPEELLNRSRAAQMETLARKLEKLMFDDGLNEEQPLPPV